MRLSIRLDEELAKKAQASAGGIPMAAWVRLLIETEIGDTSPDPTAERFKRMEARLQAVEDEVFRMLKENSPPVEYPIEPIPDMDRTITCTDEPATKASFQREFPKDLPPLPGEDE
tara:strand:- start:6891 stop:7238 length:348 start_codon:yes stop_codon:yes gene_type:complete